MNKDYTDITIVLDRSGSMGAVAGATIEGFNEFLQSQRQDPGLTILTLRQFDTVHETVFNAESIHRIPNLSHETFVPRGGTALLDAIGQAVTAAGERFASMAEADRPSKVIFVILTDGGENASTEYTRAQIHRMISHQQTVYSWEFLFIGANQDAIKVGSTYGFTANKSMTYAANAVGTQHAFRSAARMSSNWKAGIADEVTLQDRNLQTEAGAKGT